MAPAARPDLALRGRPEIEFEDIGWPVSQVTFVTARASWTVICTIAPYMYTVDLRLGQDGEDVVRLRLPEVVQTVEVDRTHGAEALVVSFERDSRPGALRLQLKPSVTVTFDAQPPWAT